MESEFVFLCCRFSLHIVSSSFIHGVAGVRTFLFKAESFQWCGWATPCYPLSACPVDLEHVPPLTAVNHASENTGHAGAPLRRLLTHPLWSVKRSGTTGSHRDATVNRLRNHQTASTAATLFSCSHQFTSPLLPHPQFYLLTHQWNGNALKTVCQALS